MKNAFLKKSILALTVLSLLPTFYAQAHDRDLDLYKAEWPDLATKVVHLRDIRTRLEEENKKLEATIEPRSYSKGLKSGLIQGTAIGAIAITITTFIVARLKPRRSSGGSSNNSFYAPFMRQ